MHINSNELLNNVTTLLLALKHNMYIHNIHNIHTYYTCNHNIKMLEKILM